MLVCRFSNIFYPCTLPLPLLLKKRRQSSGQLGDISGNGGISSGGGDSNSGAATPEEGEAGDNRLVEHFVVVGVPVHHSLRRQQQHKHTKEGSADAAVASSSNVASGNANDNKSKKENEFIAALELILEAQSEDEFHYHNDSELPPQLQSHSLEEELSDQECDKAQGRAETAVNFGDKTASSRRMPSSITDVALADAVASVKKARFQAQILDAFPQPPGMTSSSPYPVLVFFLVILF